MAAASPSQGITRRSFVLGSLAAALASPLAGALPSRGLAGEPAGYIDLGNADIQRRVNVFVSNFTESDLGEFDRATASADQLAWYALVHRWLNYPDQFYDRPGITAGWPADSPGNLRLAAADVDATVQAYFGIPMDFSKLGSISPTPGNAVAYASSPMLGPDGYVYFAAQDGLGVATGVGLATRAWQIGDATWEVQVDEFGGDYVDENTGELLYSVYVDPQYYTDFTRDAAGIMATIGVAGPSAHHVATVEVIMDSDGLWDYKLVDMHQTWPVIEPPQPEPIIETINITAEGIWQTNAGQALSWRLQVNADGTYSESYQGVSGIWVADAATPGAYMFYSHAKLGQRQTVFRMVVFDNNTASLTVWAPQSLSGTSADLTRAQ